MQMDWRKAKFFREYKKQFGNIPDCVFNGVMGVDLGSKSGDRSVAAIYQNVQQKHRKKIKITVVESKPLTKGITHE